MRRKSACEIRRVAADLHDLRTHAHACASYLAATLSEWVDAPMVDVGRRATRSDLIGWLPSGMHGGLVRPKLSELEDFHRNPDLRMPKSEVLLAEPALEASFIASSTPMPLLPARQTRLLSDYLDLIDFGDSITFKSHRLGQDGYVGWVCVKRTRGAPQFTTREEQALRDLLGAIGPWFWRTQRPHLDAMAWMDEPTVPGTGRLTTDDRDFLHRSAARP